MNRKLLEAVAWLAIAVPAGYQLVLLVTAVAGRVAYPYDLEWMEGGMLHHALRLQTGHGIYGPPSIDFIPYLYTPLYPALLAGLGNLVGLSYALGRAISIASLVGIAITAFASIAGGRGRRNPMAWCGALLALGLFAAIYPFVEGWYDLVRADTLFLMMITAGIAALPRLASSGSGWRAHGKLATVAAVLAMSFFCKQTGIFYVALGGAIVILGSRPRAITYIAVTGAIGLGGTALMNAATDGWFWTYISKIHRAHDFNMDRFWKSFGNVLWHFPALTIVVALALIVTGVTWVRRRELPPAARPFLLWSATFAVSTVVGAIGWGTEFAHYNAYMPAFLHGALAAGAAIPLLGACFSRRLVGHGVAGVAAIALAYTCYHARWDPAPYIPKPRDVVAGDRLIARLAALDGDVWMPSHPWYLVLAGKTPHVHRMGVKDVTTRQSRVVEGLDDALRSHRFGAIVMDDRDLFIELPLIGATYRPALKIPGDERPHVFTGAQVVPDTIWVPRVAAAPPSGAKTIFDFEAPTWTGWTRSGPAWGDGPAIEALPGQDLVMGATGHGFATSMHGGDAATGRVTSPAFAIDGPRITLALGGGTDATKLRVELWIDGTIVRTASPPAPGGDTLRTVTWNVADLTGKQATLVLVDDSATGHLDVDDIWLWGTV